MIYIFQKTRFTKVTFLHELTGMQQVSIIMAGSLKNPQDGTVRGNELFFT